MNPGGHAQINLSLFQRGYRVAEGHIRRQVERQRNGGVLPLMVHLEQGTLRREVGNG
jgi:hypothetical protein